MVKIPWVPSGFIFFWFLWFFLTYPTATMYGVKLQTLAQTACFYYKRGPSESCILQYTQHTPTLSSVTVTLSKSLTYSHTSAHSSFTNTNTTFFPRHSYRIRTGFNHVTHCTHTPQDLHTAQYSVSCRNVVHLSVRFSSTIKALPSSMNSSFRSTYWTSNPSCPWKQCLTTF